MPGPVVLVPVEGCVEIPQKAFHLPHRSDWHELDSIVEIDNDKSVPRMEMHSFANRPGNQHPKPR